MSSMVYGTGMTNTTTSEARHQRLVAFHRADYRLHILHERRRNGLLVTNRAMVQAVQARAMAAKDLRGTA